MPQTFVTQRSLLRNICLSPNAQLTFGETMLDSAFTYHARAETNGFAQLMIEKESDYQYAGKGQSFATEARTITKHSTCDLSTRADDFTAGWLLAFCLGADAFTAGGVLATPTIPVLSSVAGGTLAATTYYVKITYTNGGGESLPSPEASLAVVIDDVLSVASPAASGSATGYNVYVSTATGTETKQNNAPIAIGTAWTEPTTGLISGATPPTAASGGNTHVINWADNGGPAAVTSLYIEDSAGLKRLWQDMALTQLVLSGTDKGSIGAKATFLGTGRYVDGAFGALPPLSSAVQYLYGSDTTVSIGPTGAPASMSPRVLSWEATFDRQAELFRSAGCGIYPNFIRNGNPLNKLKIVVALDTTTDVRDWMVNQTVLEIKLATQSGAAGLTLDYPSVIIPKSDLGEHDKYVAYTIELDEKSILQPVGTNAVTATVTNSFPAYLAGV